jgi:hypothetical protein
MVAKGLQLYLEFAHSALGGALLIVVSLTICLAILLWARNRGHAERWPLFLASSTLAIIVALLYGLAVVAGWWGGAYFQTPLIVQMATLLPVSMVVWGGWLLGYGWLTDHSRHPLLIYLLIGIGIVGAVAVADSAELSGGLLLVADDGTTWIDAVIAVGVLLLPVLLFEGIRRGLSGDTLP